MNEPRNYAYILKDDPYISAKEQKEIILHYCGFDKMNFIEITRKLIDSDVEIKNIQLGSKIIIADI